MSAPTCKIPCMTSHDVHYVSIQLLNIGMTSRCKQQHESNPKSEAAITREQSGWAPKKINRESSIIL